MIKVPSERSDTSHEELVSSSSMLHIIFPKRLIALSVGPNVISHKNAKPDQFGSLYISSRKLRALGYSPALGFKTTSSFIKALVFKRLCNVIFVKDPVRVGALHPPGRVMIICRLQIGILSP